ncbi:Citrate lyase beta subunit [Lentzea xinjiangensis]|uniref:Citrate lyase beta subunit n=1 Tax=Lentzea xinjiangensis TaxID=402600 RepID=A0A1H9Q541_9PSEU|nr:aldolase [Lentzea xinjiangensis]SER55235.1 Citrate lyase beta subunit [Lentzea xinjiangensis]
MYRTSLSPDDVARLTARLSTVERRWPVGRQPVHTCYVPAGRIIASTVADWGREALASIDPGLLPDLPEGVLDRVEAKLRTEPVEDLRIDFEDGYGAPEDDVEDMDAESTAHIVSRWLEAGTAPPSFGLRIKSFDTPASRERGLRTLDIFLTALGEVPPGFVITFPKVTSAEQVEVFAEVLDLFGEPLRFEIQVETTRSVVDAEGRLAIPRLVAAGGGKVTGLHFGTYDYTADCGLSAAQQHLAHPACDFARHVMQVSAAGTGVRLSDGSTNVLPVGDQKELGWRTHYEFVRRSLANGFYQGWDLHPAQLVTRYAAVYGFYREGLEADAARLKAYAQRLSGGVLDEPATAQALSSFFLRAVDCGALDPAEVQVATGLDEQALRGLATRSG